MSKSYLESEAAAAHPYAIVGGYDQKAWAKRIIFREQRKDPMLLPVQVLFAKQALGLIQQNEKK